MKYKDDWKPFGTSLELYCAHSIPKRHWRAFCGLPSPLEHHSKRGEPWPANGAKALFKIYTGCGISCLRSQTHDFSVSHTVGYYGTCHPRIYFFHHPKGYPFLLKSIQESTASFLLLKTYRTSWKVVRVHGKQYVHGKHYGDQSLQLTWYKGGMTYICRAVQKWSDGFSAILFEKLHKISSSWVANKHIGNTDME